MEPRARAARHKDKLNFADDLRSLLHGFGAPAPPPSNPHHHHGAEIPDPYPETLRVLDELLTDFIIEICHTAVATASYAGRQKLKVDDFRFVLRKDPEKLGRVQQMYVTNKDMAKDKKPFDLLGMEGVAKLAVNDLEAFAQMGGEEGTGRGKGRGRGRKRKREGKLRDQLDGVGGDDGGDGEEGEEEGLGKRGRSEMG